MSRKVIAIRANRRAIEDWRSVEREETEEEEIDETWWWIDGEDLEGKRIC